MKYNASWERMLDMSTKRFTLYEVIKGRAYRKSSYSPMLLNARCVGVSFEKGRVFVTNTNTKDNPIEFSVEEWKAFIRGVKAGEFEADS